MLYQFNTYLHHNNYSYKHIDDGNHGDNSYHEYELYSDRGEPDHWEPKPTTSEPKPYDSGEGDTQHCDDVDHEYVPKEHFWIPKLPYS
jgi:hypothetical protein